LGQALNELVSALPVFTHQQLQVEGQGSGYFLHVNY
jgi:hypothetical protein